MAIPTIPNEGIIDIMIKDGLSPYSICSAKGNTVHIVSTNFYRADGDSINIYLEEMP